MNKMQTLNDLFYKACGNGDVIIKLIEKGCDINYQNVNNKNASGLILLIRRSC